ncbi:MAG TPA: hypothetical protein VH951_14280, partial [Dehalococcoidia bacterium]
MDNEPSISEWRDLYEAARLFGEAAPWEVLLEDQIFGVELPDTGETLYCSIIGADGGPGGLHAVRGASGMYAYDLLIGDELDEDEGLTEEDSLTFMLGSRDLVTPEDRKVHASLGLKFRGRAAWPVFLSVRPHYVGRRPDAPEARALTTTLLQARLFVEGLLGGDPLPTDVKDTEVVGRRRDQDGAWQTTVLPLPPPQESAGLTVDPALCDSVLRTAQRSRAVWEVRMANLGPVEPEEGGAAFWGRLLFCVDRDSGLILSTEVAGPGADMQGGLVAAVRQSGTLPRTIDLTSGLLERQLQPVADVLGIRLHRVKRLRSEKTYRAMKNAFGGLLNTRRHYTHSWIHETLVDLLAIQRESHS